MARDETIDTLNDLLETSLDGEAGFGHAARYAESPSLRQVFLHRAQDCQRAAEELRTEILALGGRPREHGSGGGLLHRMWLNVRGKLASHSDAAMLDECERGEDVATARYEKALDASLPDNVRLMIERQFEGALRNHDQIRHLRYEFEHQSLA